MKSNPESKPNACMAVCSCGWRSTPYLFEIEGGEDCAIVSAIIETRLGHLKEKAAENGNGYVHQISYEKLISETG
jgi:hypothetical protein